MAADPGDRNTGNSYQLGDGVSIRRAAEIIGDDHRDSPGQRHPPRGASPAQSDATPRERCVQLANIRAEEPPAVGRRTDRHTEDGGHCTRMRRPLRSLLPCRRAGGAPRALIEYGQALPGLPVTFRGPVCWLPKALPAAHAWSGFRTSCQLAGSCRGVARKWCERLTDLELELPAAVTYSVRDKRKGAVRGRSDDRR